MILSWKPLVEETCRLIKHARWSAYGFMQHRAMYLGDSMNRCEEKVQRERMPHMDQSDRQKKQTGRKGKKVNAQIGRKKKKNTERV